MMTDDALLIYMQMSRSRKPSRSSNVCLIIKGSLTKLFSVQKRLLYSITGLYAHHSNRKIDLKKIHVFQHRA